ncbi:MAG: tRNA 2-thiouridine(34) synthase MnmA [Verrucomicrobia bacterium]|nr:tRNA 2-thiouridine(34) synthase MnmA [Verrucomicrobiota bacterium]NMD19107.1 tRNA 2-thiouridine(34) synthase MnmA [Verrucomicrobiota bacterium]OQC63555.1 MAG: tRNA-specific 2-thiouridylase MnmA [Verrucomicrobia bacterium ADurb.Bin006]
MTSGPLHSPNASPTLGRVSDRLSTRVVVGMSGGVDSSTAAILLRNEGYAVVGVTLKLWSPEAMPGAQERFSRRSDAATAEDARAVCDRLGIPFHVVDGADAFRQRIIQYFADEYRAGRTPNPCAMCNARIKFDLLLSCARRLGAHQIAFGHYARVERNEASGRWLLRRGRDSRRDQSYFLFSLNQEQLAHALLPLGDLLKSQTREIARAHQVAAVEKAESMEICFVPDNDYGRFLREARLVAPHPGDIVDLHGRVLGRHEGIEFYTIGQRRGLRIAASAPLYVVDLDAAGNRVVVGDSTSLEQSEFMIERCNWIPFEAPPAQLDVMAKIRYNHPGTTATVVAHANGTARVRLDIPQRAITPGQACVFYQDDLVIGGGWIARAGSPSPDRGSGTRA